jgi:GNAT superfamily N-acetyltransferase
VTAALDRPGKATVRPLAPGDRAGWRRLWTAYLAFYETTVPEGVYETTWSRLMGDDPRDVRGLLAEVEGRPAGLVQFLFHRHGWKTRDVCYLQDLYADPEVRGFGVGRALIEAVYEAADAEGVPDVYWLTQEGNDIARRLYDRIGRATSFVKYVRG